MSQQAEPLKAQLRDRVGKGAARELRRNSMVPAVIYGDKKDPLSIALPYKDLSMRIHAGSFMTSLMTVDVEGEQVQVLPRDYQVEPVRDFITHVDFLRIGEGASVVVMIPVHFHNEDASPGIRRGGVLNVVRHEIEVECPAIAIPVAIDVDLTGLDIGDSVHISSVTLPADTVPTISDRDFTIATIAGSSAAIEEAQEETAEAMGEDEEEGEGEEEGDAEGTEASEENE